MVGVHFKVNHSHFFVSYDSSCIHLAIWCYRTYVLDRMVLSNWTIKRRLFLHTQWSEFLMLISYKKIWKLKLQNEVIFMTFFKMWLQFLSVCRYVVWLRGWMLKMLVIQVFHQADCWATWQHLGIILQVVSGVIRTVNKETHFLGEVSLEKRDCAWIFVIIRTIISCLGIGYTASA